MSTKEANQIIWLSPDEIHPHPNNPRKNLGDLTELADSIRFVGVLQNLTVVPGHVLTDDEWVELVRKYRENPSEEISKIMNDKWSPEGYTVIIGHRRHAASKLAGLEKLPCIIADMDKKQQAATMLLENMQRSDLTMYEQAQGFQMMIDLGETQNSIAEKTGLSPATVSRRLKLLVLDSDKLHKAEQRGGTLEDYIKVSEITDAKVRDKLTDAIGTSNFNWNFRDAMEKQQLKEKMPSIKEEMKSIGAKKDDSIHSWSGGYEVAASVSVSEYKEGSISKKAKKTVEYYWNICNDTTIYLFKKAAKTKSKPVQKSKKEIEVEELNQKLADLTQRAYESRREFIVNFSAGKKFAQEINDWLWDLMLEKLSGKYMNTDWELLYEKIGKEYTKNSYYCERADLERYISENPSNAYAVIATASCGRKDEGYYGRGYSERMPEYRENHTLDLLYKYLCNIGYEMSDEEKALQNGTHELFKQGAKE